MAMVTTYTAVGNKEDVSDIITNITPTETPLYSMFGKAKAKAIYHEWLEDELVPPGENAKIEGSDYGSPVSTNRERKGNYTQIFEKVAKVSGSQEAVQKYGIKSELAYQMANRMKEIARDVEYAIINNTAKVAGSASEARKMGGILAFVTTNVDDNSGTPRDLTEDLLNEGIQSAWQAGGAPNVVVVCGKHKRIISGFTAGATKYLEAEDKKLVAAVDVYESDFGVVRIIPHRYMLTNTLFILDSNYWKVAYLRPFKVKDIPPTGDYVGRVIIGELTLEARAEKANAVIKDLN
ncbi:phage head protein [Candidatus Woesearchaeota archaeon]|nr:MAG: phage head protein [Candidatus Woesearchaeota archaeon]